MKAADPIQILRSGTPGGFRFARRATEAPIVIGKETAQNLVSGFQIGSTSEAKFAGEAILKDVPETLNEALGLGTTDQCSSLRTKTPWRSP